MTDTGDFVSLKWGSIKGYRINDPETFKLLEEYYADGVPLSAMSDQPDTARKEILCKIIERIGKPVYMDWDGEYVPVEDAKKYVMEYNT